TSIFGGRGSVVGTLLGLFAIAVLQNGLRLADLPAELAGVLTGTLLLLAIGLDRKPGRTPAPVTPAAPVEGFVVKNSQVAVLCAFMVLAAVIVAASNMYLARELRRNESGAGASPATTPGAAAGAVPSRPPGSPQLTVAMMPKSKGNAYFIACRKGAEQAAQ